MWSEEICLINEQYNIDTPHHFLDAPLGLAGWHRPSRSSTVKERIVCFVRVFIRVCWCLVGAGEVLWVSISNIIHVRLIGLCLCSRAHHQPASTQHLTNNHHNKLNCQKTCWTEILRWAEELQQNDEMSLLVRLPTKLHIFAGLNFSGYKSARRCAARTAGCRVRCCVSLQRAALQQGCRTSHCP